MTEIVGFVVKAYRNRGNSGDTGNTFYIINGLPIS